MIIRKIVKDFIATSFTKFYTYASIYQPIKSIIALMGNNENS